MTVPSASVIETGRLGILLEAVVAGARVSACVDVGVARLDVDMLFADEHPASAAVMAMTVMIFIPSPPVATMSRRETDSR